MTSIWLVELYSNPNEGGDKSKTDTDNSLMLPPEVEDKDDNNWGRWQISVRILCHEGAIFDDGMEIGFGDEVILEDGNTIAISDSGPNFTFVRYPSFNKHESLSPK